MSILLPGWHHSKKKKSKHKKDTMSTDKQTVDTDMPCINPIEDIRQAALKHYAEASASICHWMGFVEDAIKNYNPAPQKTQPSSISEEEWYHASDCATNNEPALPKGECDCTPLHKRTYDTIIKQFRDEASQPKKYSIEDISLAFDAVTKWAWDEEGIFDDGAPDKEQYINSLK